MAFSAAGSERVPECPESSGLRDNFVLLGDRIDFDYKVGFFQLEADSALCGIIAVTEVDGAVLVAVPEALWDRTKAKRILPPDALRKAVRVMVPACIDEDRTSPEAQPSFKIWLGVLKECFEVSVHYDEEETDVQYAFPSDELGIPKLPFAKALVAIAKDHFEFATADEPLVSPSHGAHGLENRMSAVEAVLKELQVGIARLQPAARLGADAKAAPARPSRKAAELGEHSMELPPGLDAGVARQALQSGVSHAALAEMAKMVGGSNFHRGLPVPKHAARAPAPLESEEEAEDQEEGDGADAVGSANPIEKAIVHLSKIVGHLSKEKKGKADKSLEALLDRAESGGGWGTESKDVTGGSSRSKAAALRSLKRMVQQRPELIYKALEQRMEEDWTQAGVAPGATASSVTARGWLEHRSKIQNFQVPVRAAWCLAGIWDALRQDRVDEARARAALGVASLDQLGIDKGSWLVASEVVLEDAPPFSSFAAHRPLESWESPHTKLIDERWLDLFLAKLRDIHDFQDKKQKLTSGSRKTEETSNAAEKKEETKKKKKGGGKGNTRSEEEKTAPPS